MTRAPGRAHANGAQSASMQWRSKTWVVEMARHWPRMGVA
jgi:hypothetical protein